MDPEMSDVTDHEEGDATLEGLRGDLRAIGDRQTADTKQLNGRIGAMDKRLDATTSQVGRLAAESLKHTVQLDFLVEAERQRSHIATAIATAQQTALVQDTTSKRSFWRKVAGAVIAALLGLLTGTAASGGL